VAPSIRGESFGVVLLEAMALGTPVVASDIAGYRLAGGAGAAYFAVGDAAALAVTRRQLLAAPPRLEQLRRDGLARASEFSLPAIAARYLDIYRSLKNDGAGF
jgi:phosphatidylinositol alpha-mannosyltransferase